MDIIGVIVLIVVVFLAFRVGAFLMQLLLGLVALGLIVWLVAGLFGRTAPLLSMVVASA
jgi:hypothetical protein